MPDANPILTALISHLRETAVLRSCAGLLGWDEQTCMPPEGAEHRANQSALLAGLIHDRATAPQIGEWLSALTDEGALGGPDSPHAAIVREARRGYERATCLPRRLVEELSHTATLSQQTWVEAKRRKSFPHFRPWLEKMVALKREEADAIGFPAGGCKYDALLDDYEPGATTAEVAVVFRPFREATVQLLNDIRGSGRRPDASILTRRYPVEAQREFATAAANAIGFSFTAGRLDESAHPFCSGIGPGDCRLTTRYNEQHFPGAFFGVLHEAGHGIYEQGLPREEFGTCLGDAASLGIHESQSRMWENFVGRGKAFWKHFYPQAQAAFPEALSDVSLDAFHAAINDVQPSWIRVEADEVTYNLHIMLRFELEQQLISGDLEAADVPGAWNAAFERDFGMRPTDDSLGCLQDVHWSAGLLGYFPTYSLGNMYAAQLFEAAERDLGDLDAQFARGEFLPLKQWLNENVHRHGQRYRATRLIEVVTGEAPSHEPLMRRLNRRFRPLFGLA
ncbi:MAG: carboxypeptidase M32 [Planctomyces sp.]|nr:carboxypeptidase M32 [Planctomyces sp.]